MRNMLKNLRDSKFFTTFAVRIDLPLKIMKRTLLFFLLAIAVLSVNAQTKDWAQYNRYSSQNDSVTHRPKAVFMGNSITDNWAKFHPEFFAENDFVGRGISGQTSSQMLCRFQSDVVALHPKMVVILAGANDIAMNNGYIALEHILQNIQSMCELAKYHHIKPVLCSCLPAYRFKWRPDLTPAEDIIRLNEMIKAYAKANKIKYVDYHTALVDDRGGLPECYASDGVHPNMDAYRIMESILMEAL